MPLAARRAAIEQLTTTNGRSVAALSQAGPVLLVFLRHFGCTFCREALDDLSRLRPDLEGRGVTLVLVHMADTTVSAEYFQKYNLTGVAEVSDPDCRYYAAFGLTKGTARQLFGLHSWIRGFEAGVVRGHGVGARQLGDGFQMPGVFVLRAGRVTAEFIHDRAGDRPAYRDLLEGCC